MAFDLSSFDELERSTKLSRVRSSSKGDSKEFNRIFRSLNKSDEFINSQELTPTISRKPTHKSKSTGIKSMNYRNICRRSLPVTSSIDTHNTKRFSTNINNMDLSDVHSLNHMPMFIHKIRDANETISMLLSRKQAPLPSTFFKSKMNRLRNKIQSNENDDGHLSIQFNSKRQSTNEINHLQNSSIKLTRLERTIGYSDRSFFNERNIIDDSKNLSENYDKISLLTPSVSTGNSQSEDFVNFGRQEFVIDTSPRHMKSFVKIIEKSIENSPLCKKHKSPPHICNSQSSSSILNEANNIQLSETNSPDAIVEPSPNATIRHLKCAPSIKKTSFGLITKVARSLFTDHQLSRVVDEILFAPKIYRRHIRRNENNLTSFASQLYAHANCRQTDAMLFIKKARPGKPAFDVILVEDAKLENTSTLSCNVLKLHQNSVDLQIAERVKLLILKKAYYLANFSETIPIDTILRIFEPYQLTIIDGVRYIHSMPFVKVKLTGI